VAKSIINKMYFIEVWGLSPPFGCWLFD